MTRTVALIAAWLVFAVAVTALIAMPTGNYDWMTEMDPAVAPGSIADDNNQWPTIAAILLAAAIAAQAVVWRLSAGGLRRIVPVVAAILAVAIWAMRFGF